MKYILLFEEEGKALDAITHIKNILNIDMIRLQYECDGLLATTYRELDSIEWVVGFANTEEDKTRIFEYAVSYSNYNEGLRIEYDCRVFYIQYRGQPKKIEHFLIGAQEQPLLVLGRVINEIKDSVFNL